MPHNQQTARQSFLGFVPGSGSDSWPWCTLLRRRASDLFGFINSHVILLLLKCIFERFFFVKFMIKVIIKDGMNRLDKIKLHIVELLNLCGPEIILYCKMYSCKWLKPNLKGNNWFEIHADICFRYCIWDSFTDMQDYFYYDCLRKDKKFFSRNMFLK